MDNCRIFEKKKNHKRAVRFESTTFQADAPTNDTS